MEKGDTVKLSKTGLDWLYAASPKWRENAKKFRYEYRGLDKYDSAIVKRLTSASWLRYHPTFIELANKNTKPLTLLEALIKIQSKINKPSKWCAYWSESDDGKRLGVDGAIWAIVGFNTELSKLVFKTLAEYSGVNPQWDIDSRVTYLSTHKDVMAMLNKSITKLEKC